MRGLGNLRWYIASRHRSESDVRSVTVGAVLAPATTGGMTIESARGVNIRRELGAKVCVNGRRLGPDVRRQSRIERGASTNPMTEA